MTTLIHSYCSRHVLCVDHTKFENIGALKDHLIETKVFSKDACFFICNGRIVDDSDPVQKDVLYHTYPRILGGKGGFGSMLRSIGAQIEKTTNHEALRDLSGRRMRDVNNEKALKEWLEKQADKEKEREQRRQERIARRRAMPNHKFDDPVYDQQRSQLAESQEQALTEGLKKSHAGPSTSSESRKRKLDNETAGSSKQKKSTEWLGIDIDNLSDLDSDEDSTSSDSNMGNIESVTGDLQPRSSSENSCKSTDVEEQPGTSSENSCSSAADTQRSCNDGNGENRLDLNQKSAELENEYEDLHKVPETVEENKVYDQQPESSTESVSQTSNEKQQKEESVDGRKESEDKKEELCGSTEEPKNDVLIGICIVIITIFMAQSARAYQKESLLILSGIGITMKTSSLWSSQNRYFDLHHIQDIVIIEAISMQSVYFQLVLIPQEREVDTDKQNKLIPLFKDFQPSLHHLRTIYRHAQEKLIIPREQMGAR